MVNSSVAGAPFPATDELAEGVMWMAARRSTGCVVAACGVGPRFDELGQAIVTAIDGRAPIARLRRSMYSFPTVAEILGQLYDDLFDELSAG